MSGHHHPDNVVWILYLVSNLAIACGYVATPALVLPYLPLTRTILLFGAGFFGLCGLTHASMAFGAHHVPVTWFWAVEHLLQAIASWGFIITFHLLLRRANRIRLRERRRQRRRVAGAGDAVSP